MMHTESLVGPRYVGLVVFVFSLTESMSTNTRPKNVSYQTPPLDAFPSFILVGWARRFEAGRVCQRSIVWFQRRRMRNDDGVHGKKQ